MVNKYRNTFKLSFLIYSTGESGMIVELFSHRPFIKYILSSHNMGFPFSDHRTFYRKFPRNFRENFQKFLWKSLQPHLPPLPIPHTTQPHPTSNCEPTQNFKFPFLKNTFWLYFDVYFPHPSYVLMII